MENKLEFKLATEDDFEEIIKLEEESFNEYDRLNMDTLIDLYSLFKDGIHMFTYNNETIGYSVFFIEKGAGYIESIAVNNNYRGKGFGKQALLFIIEQLKGKGIKIINLHVRTDNKEAISLYEKIGFIKNGTVDDIYTDGANAYFYTLNIKDVKNDR